MGNRTRNIAIKRVYAPAAPADGTRILVDRLWPRGLSRQEAGIAQWLQEVAPSTALRKWFGHDPARWPEFVERYRAELERHPAGLDELAKLARTHTLTLLYAARDEQHNNARVLADYLRSHPG